MISKQEHNNILLEFRVQNKQLLREVGRLREALEVVKDSIPLEYNHGSELEAKKNIIRLINIESEVNKALEDEE